MDPAGDFCYIMGPLLVHSRPHFEDVKVQKYDEKAFFDPAVVLHKQEPNSSQTSAHDVTAAAPKSSVETPESGQGTRVWAPKKVSLGTNIRKGHH